MRRRLAVLALLVLSASTGVRPAPQQQGQQTPPLQADPVVRLLSDLEAALVSGRPEDFRALAAPTLPASDAGLFQSAIQPGVTEAIVRERARRPKSDIIEIVVDVLITDGRSGRIATWLLTVAAVPDVPDRLALGGLTELAAVDGLLRLMLDTTRQFSVRDLEVTAPDLTLTMSSGDAFVAESANGVTAIVLRGRGRVRFAPADDAERGQIRLFAREDVLDTEIEAAFIRLNPAEFTQLIGRDALVPREVDEDDLERGQEIFEDYAPRTYNLDLRALTPERWSLEPAVGSVVVEFESRRHGWLTYARSPTEAEDITLFQRSRNRNICVYASTEKLRERGRFYSEDDNETYDVTEYAVDLAFDPSRLWVSGRGTLRLRVNAPVMSSLTFKLAQPLAVASVSSPAFGDLLALRVVGQNNVLVSLPRRVTRGTEVVLDVVYNGRLNPQPLDREAMRPQGQIIGGQEARELMLVPEPRYIYSNRVHWYPQAPVSDFATATLQLSVPSEYQIVATGSLQGSTVGMANIDGRVERSMRTVAYEARRPVRYLSCIITRLVPVEQAIVPVPALAPPENGTPAAAAPGDPSVALEVVATPRMTSRGRQLADRAEAMLMFYASQLGEAPYPNFTLAAVDDNLPGGHSPAYFAVLNQPLPTTPYSWASDPVAFDNVYAPFFQAHEIAHQWWGQAVGWKNYHEQWISEGLAQYFAVLYAESDRGPDMAHRLLSEMRSSLQPMLRQGPISLGYRLGHIRGEGGVFRAIVYNKSAVVLHMLRRLMGDEPFFAAMRQFYTTWRFRKAGTDDFRIAFEAHASMPLGRFLDRWVLGSAIPRLRITGRPGPEGAPPVIHVDQLDDDVFDLPLTVEVEHTDGEKVLMELRITEAASTHPVARNVPIRRVNVRDSLTPVEIVR